MHIRTISSLVLRLSFSLCLVAAMVLPVQAIQVEDLYVAEVLVADESDRQLRAGARAGLLQVLVRVSGDITVEESSLVRGSLRRPADYYYQYSYESTDRRLLVGEDEREARILRLHFEPSAVARLLRDAGLPVWGSNRPGVMLWVAIADGNERRILSEADESDIATKLIEQAERRGLPILFPILDLEDASRINSAEVWGAFLDRIERASERYHPDALLTARIQQEPGRWSGKWSYQVAGSWQSLESVAVAPGELVRQMIDQLTDDLAARFALDSSRGTIDVTIENIADLDDYAMVSRYLGQLTPVLHSSVVTIQGDVARFHLRIEGQRKQLVELIELDQRMILLNQDERSERLHYRWNNS